MGIFGWLALVFLIAGAVLLISLNPLFSFPSKELNPLSFEILVAGVVCLILGLIFALAWKRG